ncbi:MAG: hypothetical protein Q9181_003187 [Wetmoreana brouardii]
MRILLNAKDTSEQQEAKENYNAWKRLIKVSPKLNDIKTIELLWTDALTILNGDDRDCKQMLPRDLDDDNYKGREHMQALLSMKVGGHGHGTFVELAHPFLSVITHPALLDCLSVDMAVGGLYNYISGSNGSRVVPFLQRLNTCLIKEYLNPTLPKSRPVLETILIAISTALRELLQREPRATFHDDLPALVDLIDTSSAAIDLEKSIVAFQIVQNGIRELRGIVGRAKGLLQNEQEPPPTGGVSTSLVTSTYPREMEMPRDRHDNDKTDITEIQILPSEDEIRCDHAPFLPSTDLNQPHFLTDQIERHLDTHFRLYRHDCFGEVSEVLGRAILAIENDPSMLESPKLTLGSLRAYTYPKAHVRYISFDRRRGLEAQISFSQPYQAQKKPSATERQHWWQDSKRLEEGSLLCLLFIRDTKVSILFFTVTEKCTDTRENTGLSCESCQAMIIAKLAIPLERDLEMLV